MRLNKIDAIVNKFLKVDSELTFPKDCSTSPLAGNLNLNETLNNLVCKPESRVNHILISHLIVIEGSEFRWDMGEDE